MTTTGLRPVPIKIAKNNPTAYNLKYIIASVEDLTPELYKLCYLTNMRDRGNIQDRLKETKRYPRPNFIIMLWDDELFLGWAFCFGNMYNHMCKDINLYLKQAARKQGNGSILYQIAYNELVRRRWNARVTAWDKRSRIFYTTMDNKIQTKVKTKRIRILDYR